jgi:small conductance mechanosensitive channel
MNILSINIEPADSLNQIQAELAAMAEKLTTTPASVLFSDLLDKIVNLGLKVLAALIIYMVGAWLIRRIKKTISRIFERKGTEAAIASFVQSMTSITLTVILIIITVGVLGVDTTSIAALLAGGGMAIGLALNGTVQNFAGGIMILIFRPFKAGDYIETAGYSGTVSEVTITSTKLRTPDNKVIIIPNGAISSSTINNYSHMPLRRLDLTIDVEYGTSEAHTREVIMEILKADQRILSSQTGASDPFVALSALKDSSVQFVIRVWVKSEDYWNVNFDLLAQIYNKLPKNNIMFPCPKLDVNITNNQ